MSQTRKEWEAELKERKAYAAQMNGGELPPKIGRATHTWKSGRRALVQWNQMGITLGSKKKISRAGRDAVHQAIVDAAAETILMTEGQFVLTHLASITKWVQEKRDYAVANYTEEVDEANPLIEELLADISVKNRRFVSPIFRDEDGTFFIDLRLQYHDEEIIPHSGLSDYDQNHHGVWSSSAIEWCADDGTCADIAEDMLTDLFNKIPEGEEDEKDEKDN